MLTLIMVAVVMTAVNIAIDPPLWFCLLTGLAAARAARALTSPKEL